MEATSKYSNVTHLIETLTQSHMVQELCRQAGCKIQLHRRDGRILAYVGSDNWTSPSFGSAVELISYCSGMLAGMTARSL